MNAPTGTNVQLIYGPDGAPAFVVIPYAEYIAGRMQDRSLIPTPSSSVRWRAPHPCAPGANTWG